MNNTFDATVQTVIALAVLSLAVLPAILGGIRDRRIDVQLRDAEEHRDRRTGVLVVFDLAYGPHEERVFRANAGRTSR
ncbi:hypothetical protein IM697_33240 [Streptomyces ferrugineus]|uniref:Uncharacterized protein n=1 Tax=Streptomyces ferrugineus TaxID=1413221 RepID=A0A7M2SGM0_9ACTN|nr:hypothetical protein [Streptomyces ferrugineus]QOV34925.1 hypothetical protein IM697_33240 [Streptomyces ferrugineus]